MFKTVRSIIAATLMALFATPLAAQAGGWVVVTLDSWPAEVVAGQDLAIGLMVRQHGHTPIAGQSPKFELTHRDSGERMTVTARDEGAVGHYVGHVTLPKPGTWTWQIDVWAKHPMPPLEVRPAIGQSSGATLEPSAQSAPSNPILSMGWIPFAGAMLAALAAVMFRSTGMRLRVR